MHNTAILRIISMLQNTFAGAPWHGPAIMDILPNLTLEQVCYRLSNTHNAAELVAHICTWREFVIQKLNGNEAFDVTHELDFPVINHITEEEWQALLDRLQRSQQHLLDKLAHYTDEKLSEQVSARDHTFDYMLHGIIHHDLYYLGQIVLLSKV